MDYLPGTFSLANALLDTFQAREVGQLNSHSYPQSKVPRVCGELHYSEFEFANLQDKQKIGGSRKGWTDKAIYQKHSDNQSHCVCQAGTLSFFKEVACVYGCQTQGAHCSPSNFPTFPTKSCGLREAKCGYYWQPCPGLKIWELLISSQVSSRTPSQFCDPSTKQESSKSSQSSCRYVRVNRL